jgi:hypothetical protein
MGNWIGGQARYVVVPYADFNLLIFPDIWAKVGSRPPMIRDNRHDSAYNFGAICPDRVVGAAIIAPAANTECMNLHLQEISTQVAPGSIAGLVCDGCRLAPDRG